MDEGFDKSKIGCLITKGTHYEIREYGKNKVVKIPLPSTVRYSGPLQAKEHYLLLKRYLGDFLPKTKFVESKSYQYPLVIQKKIKGKSLRQTSWKETKKSEVLRKNLLKLIKGVIRLEKETGKIVEMFGKGKLWWQAHPEKTDNIMIDKKGKPFLVDVFLLDPNLRGIRISLWRRIRRKWLLWLLKQSLDKMKKDLEKQ